MYKYLCSTCGDKIVAKSKKLNNLFCEHCDKLLEYIRVNLQMLENNEWNVVSLRGKRKELLSKQSKLQRHLYFCLYCEKTLEQTDYDGRFIDCSCGNGRMICLYTYIGEEENKKIVTREYNAISGEEIGKQKEYNNPLKAARKRKGLTQGELGEMFGYHQSHISQMERGECAIPQEILDWMGE